MLTMSIFLAILAIIIFVCLVLAAAMHPVRPQYSLEELKRRAKKSDAFVLELDRYELHASVVTILRSLRAVLLLLLVCFLIGAFGWFFGIVLALVIALIYPGLARLKGPTKAGRALYTKLEAPLLDGAARFERVFHSLREPNEVIHEAPVQLHSREDLAELIERSTEIAGAKERALLESALAFPDKTVSSIMTP